MDFITRLELLVQKYRLFLIYMSFIVIYLLISYFVFKMPYATDDYVYSANGNPYQPFTPNENYSLFEMASAQWWEYMNWSGRLFWNYINRLMFQFPFFSDLVTPAVFVYIIFSSLLLIHGETWRDQTSPLDVWLIFSLMWIAIPAFGQVFFWRTGARTYAYPLLVALCYLVPLRNKLTDNCYDLSGIRLKVFYLLALIAGFGNENLGIVLVVACLFTQFISNKRKLGFNWVCIAALLTLSTWLIVILAPGNFKRLAFDYPDYCTLGFVERLLVFCEYYLKYHAARWMLLYLLFVSIGYGVISGKKRFLDYKQSFVLFVFSELLVGAFIFSPTPPERAETAGVFFLILSAYTAFRATFIENTEIKTYFLNFFYIGLLACFMIHSLVINSRIFYENHEIDKERLHILHNSMSKDVILPPYVLANKYFFINQRNDVQRNPNHWINMQFIRRFMLKSVSLADTAGE